LFLPEIPIDDSRDDEIAPDVNGGDRVVEEPVDHEVQGEIGLR
jgi:hypothetical protein